MYRDDCLEFNKGSLLVKKTETAVNTGKDGKIMEKQRRSIKFDFSGTNYEVQTLGYLSGIEDEHKIDPDLFAKICDKAKQASGARIPTSKVDDKFVTIRLDPAFLARASLRAKISSRRIHKETSSGNCNADEANDGGDEYKKVIDDEASANEDNDDHGGLGNASDHSGGDSDLDELTELEDLEEDLEED